MTISDAGGRLLFLSLTPPSDRQQGGWSNPRQLTVATVKSPVYFRHSILSFCDMPLLLLTRSERGAGRVKVPWLRKSW